MAATLFACATPHRAGFKRPSNDGRETRARALGAVRVAQAVPTKATVNDHIQAIFRRTQATAEPVLVTTRGAARPIARQYNRPLTGADVQRKRPVQDDDAPLD